MTSTVMISTVVERARREQAAIEAVYPTDKTELAESWSRTFVVSQIAFDIGASIARSGGGVEDNSGYQQLRWTKFPNNFVLDKPNPSDAEVACRLGQKGWLAFCKDPNISDDAPPPPGFSFKEHLVNMRDHCVIYSTPRIPALALVKFQSFEPDYTFGGGRRVMTLDDLEDAIMYEEYDSAMRARIHYLQNQMWGSSNQGLLALANQFMRENKIMYSGFNVDGSKPSKNHKGGSIKGLMVRLKNSILVSRIRSRVRDSHAEILYKRDNKGISKHVVKLINATVAKHGFYGMIGICHGHQSLFDDVARNTLENSKNTPADITPATPTKEKTPPRTEKEMQEQFAKWIMEKRSEEKKRASDTPEGSGCPYRNLMTQFQQATGVRLEEEIGQEEQPELPLASTDEDTSATTASDVSVPGVVVTNSAMRSITLAESDDDSTVEKVSFGKRKPASDPTPTSKRQKKKVTVTKKRSTGAEVDRSTKSKTTSDDESEEEPMNPCKHDELSAFQNWDNTYYAPSFLSKKKTVPRMCAGNCQRKFIAGRLRPDGKPICPNEYFKVTARFPVHCCRNAIDDDHACDYGLCDACFSMKVLEQNHYAEKNGVGKRSGRAHNKRRIVMPGEVTTEDGDIVAAH